VAYRDVRPKNSIVPASHGRSRASTFPRARYTWTRGHSPAGSRTNWRIWTSTDGRIVGWMFWKRSWLTRSAGVEVFSTVVYGIGSRQRTSDGDQNSRHRLDATATWSAGLVLTRRRGSIVGRKPVVVSAVSAVVVVFSTLLVEGQSRVCRAFLMEFNWIKENERIPNRYSFRTKTYDFTARFARRN